MLRYYYIRLSDNSQDTSVVRRTAVTEDSPSDESLFHLPSAFLLPTNLQNPIPLNLPLPALTPTPPPRPKPSILLPFLRRLEQQLSGPQALRVLKQNVSLVLIHLAQDDDVIGIALELQGQRAYIVHGG